MNVIQYIMELDENKYFQGYGQHEEINETSVFRFAVSYPLDVAKHIKNNLKKRYPKIKVLCLEMKLSEYKEQ